jgi:formylglycine-generating enzyme required for sulfatase activity
MVRVLLTVLLVILAPIPAPAGTGSIPNNTPSPDAPLPLFHGDLLITAQPADAEVRLDGQRLLSSAAVLHREPGLHRVDVFKPGYRLKSFNILVPPDTLVTREVILAVDPGPDAPPTSPGQVFRDCEDLVAGKHVCPEMVVIPPGSFIMGAKDGEITGSERKFNRFLGRLTDDGPPHPVTLSYPFAVGRFEVTFDDWDACEADGGCRIKPFWNFWERGRQPMIMVSWDDTQQYVRWLGNKTGKNYRLLSEAEWEYAARAGTTTPYYTGNYITSAQANFDGYCSSTCNSQVAIHPDDVTADERNDGTPGGIFLNRPIEVGSFAPNDFGLYDMAGNVSQWVQDCWNRYDDGKRVPIQDFVENCRYRVTRGGEFASTEGEVRSAYRLALFHDSRWPNVGFRIARTLEDQLQRR